MDDMTICLDGQHWSVAGDEDMAADNPGMMSLWESNNNSDGQFITFNPQKLSGKDAVKLAGIVTRMKEAQRASISAWMAAHDLLSEAGVILDEA